MSIKNTLNKYLNKLDIHTLEVVKKSSASMLVKIGGMAAAFAVSIILGRTVGPEGLGIINLANRVVAIVLIFAMLGMNNVVLKEVAIGYERKDWQHIANTMFTAFRINMPLAIVFSGLFLVVTPWLSEKFFHEPDLKVPLLIALSVVVFQVLSRIFASGVNGFRKIWQSSLVNDTLSAGIVALGLAVLVILKVEITIINVAVIYAISRVSVTLTVGLYWRKLFRYKDTRRMQTKPMLKVALPLLVVSSTSLIANNADTIMLGWLSNTTEVGIYSVAARLALLTSFFHMISVSILSPKIATLYAEGKRQELQKMIQQVTKGLIFVGFASLITFLFLGKFILSIWGSDFISAYSPLVILAIGQLFQIGTGATGIILMMTGHEKILGYVSISFALTNLILNFYLIPPLGASGAALATGSTLLLQNIIKIILVKQKTGILTIPF